MINKNVTDNVTETDEQKIIRLIKDDPSCTRNDLAKAIGKTVRTVQRILNASTKIRRVDEDYGGHWEVIDWLIISSFLHMNLMVLYLCHHTF